MRGETMQRTALQAARIGLGVVHASAMCAERGRPGKQGVLRQLPQLLKTTTEVGPPERHTLLPETYQTPSF